MSPHNQSKHYHYNYNHWTDLFRKEKNNHNIGKDHINEAEELILIDKMKQSAAQ